MELRPEIQLKQTQKLVMTPQLQQSIKMLQLSNLELLDQIEAELAENPVLEIDEESENSSVDNAIEFQKAQDEKIIKYDEGFEDEHFFGDKSFPQSASDSEEEDKKREFLEGAVSKEETLREYLWSQLHLLEISDEDMEIAQKIITYIDPMGYLSVPMDTLSEDLGIPLEKAEQVLKIIQSLDPPGVGARDIKECLLIQLRNKGDYPLAEKIVMNHLNEVKLNKYEEIAKKLGVSVKKVKDAVKLISKLEPYPGRPFYTEEIRYIIPDVIIERRDGDFEVIPNNSFIPRIKVNDYYLRLLRSNKKDKNLSKYLTEKIQRAQNFIKSINQREETLVRVTKAILEEQREFFEKGPKYLKPLTLKDIAQKLDLHESTISRITSSKYVQTPFGVFQLKYFFSNPIPSRNAGEYSSRSIKEMIKDIIESEGSKKHLSDQKIADILNKRGIKIARRTVAKYRQELKILPSILRRQ
ncbi:MAG: RNA polymerase sigma-54 factor [Spirochaetes bacterium]|nr:MAG: RNA polymerase sigma-54 factor [Spirochaetota bacterium]